MLVTVTDSGEGRVRMFHQRVGWYKRDRLGAIVENMILRVADTSGRTSRTVMVGKVYPDVLRSSRSRKTKPAHKKARRIKKHGRDDATMLNAKQDWSFFVADVKRNPPRHLPTSNCLSRTTIDRFGIHGTIRLFRVSRKVVLIGKA